MGKGGGWEVGIVILSSCEYYFIRVHENLVQHPSDNISIVSASCQGSVGFEFARDLIIVKTLKGVVARNPFKLEFIELHIFSCSMD